MLGKSTIKYIQSLGQKKFRQQEGKFIAEGPKLVNDLLEMKSSSIQEIFALKEWIEDNKKIADSYQVVEITTIELEKISQLSSHNQVVAVVKQFDIDENIDPPKMLNPLSVKTITDRIKEATLHPEKIFKQKK